MQIPGFRGILGQFCQALVGRWTRPALKPVSDLSLPSTHLPAGQASHIFTCSCHEKCLQWQTGAPWVSTLVPKLWREVASGNLRWICLRSWPKLWNQMRALFVIFGVSWCRFAIQLCTGCTLFFFKSCSRTLFEDFEEWTIFYMSIGTGLTNCRSIAPYCTNCSSTIGSCQAIGMDPQLWGWAMASLWAAWREVPFRHKNTVDI